MSMSVFMPALLQLLRPYTMAMEVSQKSIIYCHYFSKVLPSGPGSEWPSQSFMLPLKRRVLYQGVHCEFATKVSLQTTLFTFIFFLGTFSFCHRSLGPANHQQKALVLWITSVLNSLQHSLGIL